jgi:hypothetical protein
MKKNYARFAVAASLLAGVSAACPATASADAAQWQMPDLTKTKLQDAVSTVSSLLGGQAKLVLIQPDKQPPTNGPADTLYMHPEILNGDLQPVYDAADWEVCEQSPAANSSLTLSPRTDIRVKIARPNGCPK